MPKADPVSKRLSYRRIRPSDLEAFHALIVDPHVLRFLLDGEMMSREWCAREIQTSAQLFERAGLGLWLLYEADGENPIGFCGFRVFEELGPEPQLLYAFTERHTGKGYATEVARALVTYARAGPGLRRIVSAADEPNAASIRVLQKVGFRRCGETPGAFGRTLIFEHLAMADGGNGQ